MSNLDDSTHQDIAFPAPIIFLAKGGGGSRLLSVAAADLGIFIGSKVNKSGDSVEMVPPIYRGVIRTLCRSMLRERDLIPEDICSHAFDLWRTGGSPDCWGFKLPESLFLIEYIYHAFPKARFIHMIRDPLSTCLRRTHLTARLNNEIGRITLPAAYQHSGHPVTNIYTDSDSMHMAYTTKHQLSLALKALSFIPDSQQYEVRFETMISDPLNSLLGLSKWLGVPTVSHSLLQAVDPGRATTKPTCYADEELHKIKNLLRELRSLLGYSAS